MDERIEELLYFVDMSGTENKSPAELSGGMKKRIALARAMIMKPRYIFYDEPTTGLDPNQIAEIRELIRSMGEEKTVILSTHILPEVQASCDRVLIIDNGKIVADGSPDSLQAHFIGGQKIHFGVEGNGHGVAETLSGIDQVRILESESQNGSTLFTLGSDAAVDLRPRLFDLAVESGWRLTELHREEASLEDVFRQLTSGNPQSMDREATS